ncbi:MAG: phosphate propanoyltransferase [Clostridiales bacterium]|nr:phosphate propanoyltransferase [Clostridiales bacterium]
MERKEIEQLVRMVVARLGDTAEHNADKKAETFFIPSEPSPLPPDLSRKPALALDDHAGLIPVEVSARHVHLCSDDLKKLFGTSVLPDKQAISQPGQYLSEYRVRLIGPQGILDKVAVLGPLRDASQVEISATDARTLGVDAPLRLSGDLRDAAMVCIQAGDNMVQKPCAIIAKRHVHMTPEDASAFHVSHGQDIALRVEGQRGMTLHAVTVRVSGESALALHLDTDEANAAGAWKDISCSLSQDHLPAAGSQSIDDKGPSSAAQTDAILESKLISERDVLSLKKTDTKTLRLKKGQIITPLAIDALKACGITLIRERQE